MQGRDRAVPGGCHIKVSGTRFPERWRACDICQLFNISNFLSHSKCTFAFLGHEDHFS